MSAESFDAEVVWGERKFIIHMEAEPSPVPGRTWWRGRLGAIEIAQQLTVHGNPMVEARTPVHDVLDPMDGVPHSLSGGYHDDVPSAVAGLYVAVQTAQQWLVGLVPPDEGRS